MAGIVAKQIADEFCYSHLTRNIFNLYMCRFFFGLVYMYRLKIAGTDQISFGPVPVLMVVKIIWSTAVYIRSARFSEASCSCSTCFKTRFIKSLAW